MIRGIEFMTMLANDTLGQLFTVPEKDWTVINKRVGEAAAVASVTGYIEQYIPEFPLLVSVCDVWKNQTYDSLIRQSAGIILYARNAADDFASLSDLIQMMDNSSDELSDNIKQQVWALLKKLDERTVFFSKPMEEIETDISIFLSVNQDVDRQISRYKDKLGIFWEPFEDVIPEINLAAGIMGQGWRDLSQKLQEFSQSGLNITLPLLKQLDIETALVYWQNLESDARIFRAVAERQKFYWD